MRGRAPAAPEQIGASLDFIFFKKLYKSDNQLLLDPFRDVIIIKESTPTSDLVEAGLVRAEPSAALHSGDPALCQGAGLTGETQARVSPSAFTKIVSGMYKRAEQEREGKLLNALVSSSWLSRGRRAPQ